MVIKSSEAGVASMESQKVRQDLETEEQERASIEYLRKKNRWRVGG